MGKLIKVDRQDSKTAKSKRFVSYDVLRILAIFAVILIHTTAENWYVTSIDNYWLVNNFVNALSRWAVPMFAVITGALLLGKDKISIKTVYVKYIPRILICLIIWHFIYYFYVVQKFSLDNIIQAIKNGILGKSYSHLWYLYLLLGFYILLPILNKLVKVLDKKELVYLLILGFTITALIPDIISYTNINLTKLIEPYKLLAFNIYIFYFILGYYLKEYKSYNKKIDIAVFLLSSFLLVIIAICSNIISVKKQICIQYSSSVASTMLIISLFSITNNIFLNKGNIFINKLGELTFGVYLIHFLVEKILLNYGIQSNMVYPIIGVFVVSILIMVISYVISYIISKVPCMRKIIGL